jgi:ATP-binding cassette subfamily B protein
MSGATPSLTDLAIYRRLASETRPYRPHIAGIFVISMLSAPLTLLTPVPLAVAVDSVIGTKPLPGFLEAITPSALSSSQDGILILVAVMFLAVAVLTQVQDLGNTVLKTYTGEKLVLNFRSKLFQQSQRLSLAYHDRVGTSDSTYRVQEDAKALQYIAVESLISLVTAATTLAAMIYVTARIDLQLALVALAVTPPLLLAARHFRPRMRTTSREVKKLESGALSVVQEVLTGLRMVKAFSQEDREHERFVGRSSAGMRARIRLRLIEGGYAVLVGAIIGAGGSVVLYVGIQGVQNGRISLGELLLVMGYLSQLYAPIKTMARKAGSLQDHLASAERTFALLDEAPEVPERPDALPLAHARGAVEFRDVSFSYEPDRLALESISFAVEPGVRVGIAGATGAGKTTLMNLLTRFYDPVAGQILVDGVDLRDYRLADLRNQFGIVLQEPVLFSTSIAENIAYARPDAGQGEIEAAAAAANIHDFIVTLPDGYETQVGERGMRLSGGERQRISLARAFLKDAPILILDEPTSSVDVKTEAIIMDAMNRLMAGRTSFMIAHRLSTLDACDMRLEIEHGRLLGAVPAQVAGTGHAARNGGLEKHPAVKAWSRLGLGAEPQAVTVLKGSKKKRKSEIYRLEGCAPGGESVIAKRCKRGTAEVENTIYEDVLPVLPITSLRYYGMVDEGEEQCWIFVEDAGDERYSPLIPEHRRLAARWLAVLHGTAPEIPQAARLPDRGPRHYLTHLQSGRDALLQQARDRSAHGEEVQLLTALVSQLDTLESRWKEVSAFCKKLPRTIVHGDLSRSNVRVRAGGNGMELVAFDWEKAGWGVPAPDLARLRPDERLPAARFRESGDFPGFCIDPCLDTYGSTLRNGSTHLSRDTLERTATVGNIFRCLATVHWLSRRSSPTWTPVIQLELCSLWLSNAMQAAGWNERPRRQSLDEELRQTVERALARVGPNGSPLAAIHRRGFEGATSYAVEIVTAELESGRAVDMFLKDFGESKLPKDAAAERRERELRVYDDLLEGEELGTARFYGARWDERAGRFWLMLEFVDGKPLRNCGFDHWLEAAAWLGRLHACFAGQRDRLQASSFLMRHDAGFFVAAAVRALGAGSTLSPALVRRLDRVLDCYHRIIGTLARESDTLVHGSYRPQNVLVVPSSEPPRICPTDWELAAFGRSTYDLAFICDGFDPQRLDALLDAYEREAERSGLPLRERDDLRHEIDCFRLHKMIRSLGHLDQWKHPAETAAKVVASAEEIAGVLA